MSVSYDQDVLVIGCPTCGRFPGQPCRWETARSWRDFHDARVDLAKSSPSVVPKPTTPGTWSDRPERPPEKRRHDPFLELRQELIENPGRTRRLDGREEVLRLAKCAPQHAGSAAGLLLARLKGGDRYRQSPPVVPGRFDAFDGRGTDDVFVWYEALEEDPEERTWWQRFVDWIGNPPPVETPAAPVFPVNWVEPSKPWPRTDTVLPEIEVDSRMPPCKPPPASPARTGLLGEIVECLYRGSASPSAELAAELESYAFLYGDRTVAEPEGHLIEKDETEESAEPRRCPTCEGSHRVGPSLGPADGSTDGVCLPAGTETAEMNVVFDGEWYRLCPACYGQEMPLCKPPKAQVWDKYDPAQMVVFLEELISADPDAMTSLVASRVPCSQVLADHPTVQVGETEDGFEVGLMGILNGLCGTLPDGTGAVSVIVEDDGRVTGTHLIEAR